MSRPQVFFFLAFLASAVFAGCGGGGGGGSSPAPHGGGGGVPTPTPTVPAALVTIAPVLPNALPTTTGTLPPAIASAQFSTGVADGQYVYSAAGKINFGSTNPPSTITDTDTSGKTCLVYEPAGASSATPCPLAHATSSVVLTSSNDGYAILYNGQPVSGAAVTLNVSSPSASYSVPILGAVSLGNISFAGLSGPVGTLLLDGTNIYAAIGNPSAPLTVTTYNAATGYSAPTAITITQVNGVANTRLTANGTGQVLGGAHDITIGPDGNIWIAENNGPNADQYVAVYAFSSNAVNPVTGGTINSGPTIFAEYHIKEAALNPKPLKGIVSDGTYIWVIDNLGEFWRIDPTTGTVHPNQAASYAPAGTVTAAQYLTLSNGTAPFNSVNFSQIGNLLWVSATSSLYIGEDGAGHIVQITRDLTGGGTGAAGSSGPCVAPATPCLGYYTASAQTQNCPSGVEYIGTNLFSPDCITGKLVEYTAATPPVQTAISAASFPQFVFGGVAQTPDGLFWTVTPTGLESILSMTSPAAGYVTPSNPPCNSLTPSFRANGFITGPDGTLLFSPANPFGGATTAPVCGLVY